MRSIHAVIFDMDGLVFESERIAMRAFIRTAHHFGFQMNELMHLNLTGRVEEDCAAQMQRMYGQDKDVVEPGVPTYVSKRLPFARRKGAALANVPASLLF